MFLIAVPPSVYSCREIKYLGSVCFHTQGKDAFWDNRPEGKATPLVPAVRNRGRGLGAQSSSRLSVSPARVRGSLCVPVWPLRKGFRALFCWIWQENPGESFSLREVVVGASRERRFCSPAPQSRAAPHPAPAPWRGCWAISNPSCNHLSCLRPVPAAHRVNSFSLKNSNQNQTKQNINKTQPNKTHPRLFPGTAVATAAHREGNTGLCIETCRETPRTAVFSPLCPGNKINHENRSQSPSEMFSTDRNEAFFGSSSVPCGSVSLLPLWKPLSFPSETPFLASYLPHRNA